MTRTHILAAAALLLATAVHGQPAPDTTLGADLSVAMRGVQRESGTGDRVRITAEVWNQGPETATGVTLRLRLPEALELSATSSSQGTCRADDDGFSCSLGLLARGEKAVVSAVGTAVSSELLEASAEVTANQLDPVPGNNKTTGPAPVELPLAETERRVVAPLPAEPEEPVMAPLPIDAEPPPPLPEPAPPTVAPSPSPPLPEPVAVPATIPAAGREEADLAVAIAGLRSQVVLGSDFTFTVVVTNNGPAIATGVELAAELPASVTLVALAPSQGSCQRPATGLSCQLGALDRGAAATVPLTLRADAPGVVVASFSATAAEADLHLQDNDILVGTAVGAVAVADLDVSLSAFPEPVTIGEELVYEATVRNVGPSPAFDVRLTDLLPDGVRFLSAEAGEAECLDEGGRLACRLGILSRGEERRILLRVAPENTGTMTNTVTVTSSATDPNAVNNAATVGTTVSSMADLSLEAVGQDEAITVGDTVTYTLVARNQGPSVATDLRLEQSLPRDVRFLGATASQGSCAEVGGSLTCNLGSVAPGSGTRISVVVSPTQAGAHTAEARLSAREQDPRPEDNRALFTVDAQPVAEIAVSQTAVPEAVNVREDVVYTVVVSNAGPSAATGVILESALPQGVILRSVSPDQGTCSGESTITCDLGDLPHQGRAAVRIAVTPQRPGPITHQASVRASERDPNNANNRVDTTVAVAASADLSVINSVRPSTISLGQELTYDVEVINRGPSAATGVRLVKRLPATVNFRVAQPARGTCAEAGGTLTCELGRLEADERVQVAVAVAPRQVGTLSNTANVRADETDPDITNNTAMAVAAVEAASDVSVSGSIDADVTTVGNQLAFTVVIGNNGPSPANRVRLAADFTGGVSFSAINPSQGTCSAQGREISCDLGDLSVRSSAMVTLRLLPHSAGDINGQVRVSALESDPQPGNNSVSAGARVGPAADLKVTETVVPNAVQVGSEVNFTVVVSNRGPSPATGIQLESFLPGSFRLVSAQPNLGDCELSGAAVTCQLGSLDVGASTLVSLVGIPQASGTFTDEVRVSANEPDPEPGDNRVTAGVVVNPAANLKLSRSFPAGSMAVGDRLTYSLMVKNLGPSAATGVRLTEALPGRGVNVVAAIPSQGSCAGTADIVSCDLGNLAARASAMVTVTLTPQTTGTLTSTARIEAGEADPEAGDNTQTASIAVLPAADLAITETVSSDSPTVGTELTYTVAVGNRGPSTATRVQLINTLPSAVAFVSASPSRGRCTQSEGKLTCELGNLGGNETATVSIMVVPISAGTITNLTEVTGNEADPNPSNNTAVASSRVGVSLDSPAGR